jgi:hypothetical protein
MHIIQRPHCPFLGRVYGEGTVDPTTANTISFFLYARAWGYLIKVSATNWVKGITYGPFSSTAPPIAIHPASRMPIPGIIAVVMTGAKRKDAKKNELISFWPGAILLPSLGVRL